MTLILAMIQDGRVYMAADSVALADSFIVPREDSKIFANENLLVGYAGSYRFGQILKFASFPQPPEILPENSASEKLPENLPGASAPVVWGGPDSEWQQAERYMITEFIPALRLAIEDGGDIEDGCCIVAFGRFMFVIDTDFHVGIYRDGFAAIGLAEREALVAHRALTGAGITMQPYNHLEHILESISPYTVIEKPWVFANT